MTYLGSELRFLQDFEDRVERAMLRLIFGFDLDVGGSHAVFPDFFSGKLPARNLKAKELGAAAGVNQGAERHVTANARKTIKISEFHGMPPRELLSLFESRWRRIHSIGEDRVCQTRGDRRTQRAGRRRSEVEKLGRMRCLDEESKNLVRPAAPLPPPICKNIRTKDLRNLQFVSR